jgi:xanthosine utilization system XapX-like protein
MDKLIEFLGRDTLLAIVIFIGCVIRAGQGEKVPALQGLVSAFTPFFVVYCLVVLFEWALSLLTLQMPAVPLIALGGLFAFLGNSWIIGLIRDGKSIEEKGAVESLLHLAKSIFNLKKQP